MALTRQSMQTLEYVDWFMPASTLESRESTADSPLKNTLGQEFVGYLWPAGNAYPSVLNPAFLCTIDGAEAFNRHPVWMARDGLIPLLWFFKRMPEPRDRGRRLHSKLYVEADLWPYVPRAWRPQTGAYRVESLARSRAKIDSLLLFGIVMDTFCSVDELTKRLEFIRPRMRRGADIQVFLPTRHDGFGSEHRHGFHADYVRRICLSLGAEFKALSWSQLLAISSLQGVCAVDMNEGLLCSDNYLMHHALSRGAHPLSFNKHSRVLGRSELVQLSPTHGIRIWEKPVYPAYRQSSVKAKQDVLKAAHLQKVQRWLASEAYIRLPWPKWFSAWAAGASGAR